MERVGRCWYARSVAVLVQGCESLKHRGQGGSHEAAQAQAAARLGGSSVRSTRRVGQGPMLAVSQVS